MTTIASGRCVCAPIRVETAAGSSPSASTRSVIIVARRRRSDPMMIDSTNGMALLPKPADVEAQQNTVHHGDAENRNEADAGRNAERSARNDQREISAETRDRNLRHDDEGVDERLRRGVEDARDQQQRERHDDHRSRRLAACSSPYSPDHSRCTPSGRWTSCAIRRLASMTVLCKSRSRTENRTGT